MDCEDKAHIPLPRTRSTLAGFARLVLLAIVAACALRVIVSRAPAFFAGRAAPARPPSTRPPPVLPTAEEPVAPSADLPAPAPKPVGVPRLSHGLRPFEFGSSLGSQEAPEDSAASYAALEARTHELVNAYRASRGLPPLAYDARIAAIARRHSANMAAGLVPVGHAGFYERARQITGFLGNVRVAENVAWNNAGKDATARLSVDGWQNSPHHRENMEGPYARTGIGVTLDSTGRYLFTQLFAQ